MELTKKQKRNILYQHLKLISCFADKDYQKRVWILAIGPEVGSFDGAVCDFLFCVAQQQ